MRLLRLLLWRRGAKAPKAAVYAEFTQQFRKNGVQDAEYEDIPYKIDKN